MKRRELIKSLLVVAGGSLYRSAPAFGHQEAVAAAAPDIEVRRVLAMFKCHFDAGFIDTQKAVVERYFTQYFPQAITIAEHSREVGNARYVWTTGSWLLYEYLEQASPDERRRMEHAIAQNDIAWPSLQLADRDDGSLDDLGQHRPLPFARSTFWPNYDRSQDDRCSRPYPWSHRTAGRRGNKLSRYWGKRSQHSGRRPTALPVAGRNRPVASGDVSPRLWWDPP